jgi:hypothetical protein
MLRATKRAAVFLLAGAFVAMQASAARAEDGVGRVDCTQDPKAAECGVNVTVPGKPGGSGNGGNGGSSNGSGGSGTKSSCVWKLASPQPPPQTAGQKGAWYSQVCISAAGTQGFGSAPVWIAAGPVPDPAAVAQSAWAKLRLPSPVIRSNPDASKTDVLVTVPVWLWVDGSSWGSRSATASVPGLSVTATAAATKVVWQVGDGTSITCRQGTPWTQGTDPAKASPTCGHTYDLPGTLTMTATMTWTVTWAGGGQTGTVPNLTTTAQTTVNVSEAPAVNTGQR